VEVFVETIKKFKVLWEIIPKKDKVYYIVYSIISIAHSLLFVLLPFLYRDIINAVTAGFYPEKRAFLYIVLTIAGYASIRLWSLINVYKKEKLTKNLLDKLFSSILKLDFKSFLRKDAGYWASIFSNDVDFASQLYSDFLYTLPAEFITFIVILVILFIYSKPLLITVTIVLSMVTLISLLREKYVIPHYDRAQESLRITSDHINAHLKGIDDLIHYRGESFLKKKFLKDFTPYIHNIKNYFLRDFLNEYAINFLNEFGKFAAIGISLLFFIRGNYSFGTAVMLITFATMAYGRASYLVDNMRWLQNYPPHIETIKEAIESPQFEMEDQHTGNFEESILNDVSFSYDEKFVLENFNMYIKKGEIVALVGKSGIGKSTVLKIISGFLKPKKGEVIFLQGKPKIGMLFQEGRLFNRTLKENLLIAKPDATYEELVEALKKAGLLDWFEKLSNGFDTQIGQAGKLISGGERSRLSIARIILFDPEILLLDEPLTGVDQDRKEEILDTLKELLNGKTCILATHDKSLLRIAHRVTYITKEEDAYD